ncbi:hypothetical protein [Caldiplasma sukawensis]
MKYYVKSIIGNKNLLFWGVAFMGIWLVMGAYFFGFTPSSSNFDLKYTSTWFSLIALYSLSTIGTSIAYSIYYASSSLNFTLKFTNLTLKKFLFSIISGVAVSSIILCSIILMLCSLLFSERSNNILIPSMPYYSILIAVGAGAIMFGISASLTTIITNYFSLKNINFISFLPLILSYIFGFTMLNTSLPSWIVYGNPFSESISLFYFSFSGSIPHISLSNPNSPSINIFYMAVALITWSFILIFIFLKLVKNIRAVSIEEARQI